MITIHPIAIDMYGIIWLAHATECRPAKLHAFYTVPHTTNNQQAQHLVRRNC
jgi:hypothetical protein